MQKILGLDIGASAIKAVVVEANFRSHEVRDFRLEPLGAPTVGDTDEPESLAERLRPALDALRADGWLAADKIVCALPAARVATHLVTLPISDARRIAQTLPFEVEGLIPFDLDDVVFDYHVIARAPGKTELLVAVARKEDVRELIDALAACDVDPQVVTVSAVALAALVTEGYVPLAQTGSASENESAPPVEALVDVGAKRTDVLLFQGKRLQFARSFASGGADVTRAISQATTLSLDDAQTAKHATDLASGSDPTVRVAAERAQASLLREIRATLAGHAARTRQRVTRIHLSGGGAALAGLPAYLSAALGLAVEPLEIAEGRTFPTPERLLPAALALALALRGLEHRDTPRITFRQGEFASTRAEGGLQKRFITLGAMAAVLALLLGFSSWAKLSALEKRESALDAQLCEITKTALGKCETDYKVALGRMKGGGSPAAKVPQISASNVIDALTRAFPQGDAALLAEFDVVDDLLRLRGDAKSYEAIDDLVERLQADACLADVKKGRLVKGKNNRIDFDLDARYTCTRGGRKAGS